MNPAPEPENSFSASASVISMVDFGMLLKSKFIFFQFGTHRFTFNFFFSPNTSLESLCHYIKILFYLVVFMHFSLPYCPLELLETNRKSVLATSKRSSWESLEVREDNFFQRLSIFFVPI